MNQKQNIIASILIIFLSLVAFVLILFLPTNIQNKIHFNSITVSLIASISNIAFAIYLFQIKTKIIIIKVLRVIHTIISVLPILGAVFIVILAFEAVKYGA